VISFLIAAVSFIVIILVLVLAHEIGHFVTALIFKVRIIEFGVGFPPRVFAVKRGGVEYSINAVPLGGFVKLAGEEDPKVPGALASKSYGVRILVLCAGCLMNLILPFLLFSVAYMLPHSIPKYDVTIKEVSAGSPAETAGIEPGDVLISINGEPLNNFGDVQRIAQLNLGNEITITYKRGTAIKNVNLVPRWGQGAIGIRIESPPENPEIISKSEPVWRAVPLGLEQMVDTYVLFKNQIIIWIIGASPVQVSGIVGIAELTGEVAKAGISPLFQLAAFISINLGIVNIIPLPALDGGRIAFVALEMIRGGRRVSPRIEGLVHMIGFIILFGLMLLLIYRDIINIITSGTALP